VTEIIRSFLPILLTFLDKSYFSPQYDNEEQIMTDFLIIGADAAGLSAAVQIKQQKTDADILVIEKNDVISYAACGMPYVISKEISSVDRLIHFTPESFQKNRGVEVKTGMEAVDIFPEAHEIEIRDLTTGRKERISYKKLFT